MSKYNKTKYGKGKYGRYDIDVPTEPPLSQITKYRLRSVNSKRLLSRPIINIVTNFITDGPVKVRLRANKGFAVVAQSESIPGDIITIRVKAVSKDKESPWVESIVGTIRNKPIVAMIIIYCSSNTLCGEYLCGQEIKEA